MKIIRIDQRIIHINILGFALCIPLAGCEQTYKNCLFLGNIYIPFTSKMLFYFIEKKFRYGFYILDRRYGQK